MPTYAELQQPGYLHLLLNHWPIHGLAMGMLALAIALLLRSRTAQVVALLVLLTCALSIWPVVSSGQSSYKAIRGVADESGADWLDEHLERAEKAAWAFYALAAAAGVALVAPRKWPRSSTPLTVLTFFVAAAALVSGAYVAHAGGKIRHPEFRLPTSSPSDQPSK